MRRMMSSKGVHRSNMSVLSIKKLSLTPQRSAIPPMSGGIMIEVSRWPVWRYHPGSGSFLFKAAPLFLDRT
jgi:hypothetical protein